MIIGNFKTSSTRGKTNRTHVARVRRNGELVAQVYPGVLDPDMRGHSDPLHFVRQYPASRSRKAFCDQLKSNGVSEAEIRAILTIPPFVEKVKRPKKAKATEGEQVS